MPTDPNRVTTVKPIHDATLLDFVVADSEITHLNGNTHGKLTLREQLEDADDNPCAMESCG